jgi:hypothetical protein
MWVRDDGVVLRQEVTILRSHLRFTRLDDARAGVIAAALGDDWTETIPVGISRRLLRAADDTSG